MRSASLKASRRTRRPSSCSITCVPAGLSTRWTVRPARSRTSSSRTPYTAPLAPVIARTRSSAAMLRAFLRLLPRCRVAIAGLGLAVVRARGGGIAAMLSRRKAAVDVVVFAGLGFGRHDHGCLAAVAAGMHDLVPDGFERLLQPCCHRPY